MKRILCSKTLPKTAREDTVEFFIHPEAGIYVGQSRLFHMSGDTLEEAVKHIKRCAIEALRPDSDKEVIFDDNIDYDEKNPDDLGTLHITWIPNNK